MKILVTDGENRSSLAVTRSLGRQGAKVVVVGKNSHTLSSLSRYCFRSYELPCTLETSDKYLSAISNIVDQENINIICPMTEESIHILNMGRDLLFGDALLACPTADQMELVSDKVSLFQMAEKLGISIPKTIYLKDNSELDTRLHEITDFPVVIKPALSSRPNGNTFISGRVLYARSKNSLKYLYSTNEALRYPSMIQEKVVGPGTGLFSLYDTNRHLAVFSHRRLVEKPPSGGVSVVSQSVPLYEEMVEATDRLLSAVGWRGVAMVEFKRDQRDGKAKLMEINGRFWGSLQLAIACGIDFPALYLNYLQGTSLPFTVRDYRLNHKLKWFFGILDHILIRFKNGEDTLNLSKIPHL
jgi:predicted ATP-grasp superfamily ATP-dependent carboligase